MSELLYKKDSELQLLNSLQGSEFFTVIINGKNYRVQIATLVQLALASKPAAEDTRRYWQTVPGYTVDDNLREITVDGTGVAFYGGSSQAVATATLTYSAIAVTGNSRFDGLVLDTNTGTYALIQGTEGLDPSTPGYNTQRYMLLAWILIDENGSTVEESPQAHPRNQDVFLDQGGTNEISAAQAKSAYLKSLHFAGAFDADTNLPTGASAPTLRSWALVGTTDLSIWLYSVNSAAWAEVQGAGGGGTSADRTVADFAALNALTDMIDGEEVFVSDASGDATVDTGWAKYKYILSTTTWQKIAEEESLDQAASTGGSYALIFAELDTVSAPVPFEGPKSSFAVVAPPAVTAYGFQAKLASSGTYTTLADEAALDSWVASNVTTATTLWFLIVDVSGVTDETSILLQWV